MSRDPRDVQDDNEIRERRWSDTHKTDINVCERKYNKNGYLHVIQKHHRNGNKTVYKWRAKEAKWIRS
ncbi:hypothetical protein FACS189472_06970 [Alphaproteobacteria bacterium]|nr:hypothetical protein FACS189472_06970 [Alphaproteobacteria bacterium]